MSFLAQALPLYDENYQKFNAPIAMNSGDVIQLPDGRAAVKAGLTAAAIGDSVAGTVEGVFKVQKAANINILRGGNVYWDRIALKATFTPGAAGFYLGRCVVDALATDAYVVVDLNVITVDRLKLREGLWNSTPVKTAGSPAATRDAVGTGYSFSLDNTNEAQKIDAISVESVRTIDGPIFEARLALVDKGNNAALKIDFGLASATHASDFQSVAQQVAFQFQGNSLEVFAQSKDGTTTVAVTDTTLAVVASAYSEFWIDARDPTNVKLYMDGVQVLPATTFVLTNAAGPLYPILWVGKTANATTANVKVDFMRVRTSD